MTYQEAEAFLFEQLPMFQRVGGPAYKKDLHNTYALLEALGNPHLKGKYIHVAGTNGKGSTASFLASVLKESGYKTGLYTSPHLKSFTERMRIDGIPISKEEVIQYVEKFKPIIEELRPSFFELTTAMAFDYFAKEEVDIAVIEVGMGGRLDCTNVIQAEVSIITQIGLDHQQFLGNTLEEITNEKAGIIKENVPTVCSVSENELKLIIREVAEAKNAPFVDSKERYKISITEESIPNWKMMAENLITSEKVEFESGLSASYQIQNLSSVFSALDILKEKGYSITKENIKNGLRNVIVNSGIKGRWQRIPNDKSQAKIIADTGHNIPAFEHIVKMIEKEEFEQLHFVFATVNDKKLEGVLELLPKNAKYYFTQANIPRALNANDLKEIAFKYGLKGDSYSTVAEAFSNAQKNASDKDLIFVGGSTFAVAEIPDL
ncbi:tetrahydrofolate synthase [Marivirga tractuosa]|uniref:Dihydrofolate synthase/folylpolyglutamate synthase n=1 Tax=Marivirga tractuosa (strain ATCC 23168 / DSM 4126 / NBRC 15989 / NCIMB 1408 / VKM B-1430 / H-43) TaxID=643867 RepID=E4TMP1_MARTH|nr:folylpolyglutamate synthase/dihydrofolate synthase family protein [Marivirga tractuosa]ADR20339.1 FolC bifunctional protein [Marivirga tractuosa DSM 4126]BDD15219.1 tetrahydrofolate synthase [Marivirga tractuosa]